MSSSKRMNLICVIAIVLCLLASVLLPAGGAETPVVMGYEDKLFDVSRVHTIDISMENWDAFIETCENEEYAACDVTVDGEKIKNAAIRAKGNTSLSSVSSMNSERYSFKIEFDHYDSAFSYHGLDKLSLNNVIQDNTFMKDYLTYRMMNAFDVPAPLASFAYITVNGEDWGLYLAVEGVEDAFLMRNYGKNHGELYKPDSMSFGGGRGNGKGFDMGNFEGMFNMQNNMPEGGNAFDFRNQTPPNAQAGGFDRENQRGGFGGMGSNDVKLVYSDDNFESYSNIFESAKTDVTDADKTRLIDAIKRMNEGDTTAVNVEDVIRYFVVHNFVVNDDSYTGTMIHNYYLYEKDGKLSMIPWDYNLAYGTFQGGNASSSVNKDIDQPVSGGTSDRPMIRWIFDTEENTQKYHAYFAEFLNTVDAAGMIEAAERLIAPYVEKDPTKFCTTEQFQKGVSALKTFVSLRTESVRNQLSSSSEKVDVTGLNTSDMGTMGSGRGGFAMPERTSASKSNVGKSDDASSDSAQMTQMPLESLQMPFGFGDLSSMPEGGFQPPTDGAGMPEMPTGGFQMPTDGTGMPEMPSGGFQMPTDGAGMPEMPSGGFQMPTDGAGMPQMPSGGFQMPTDGAGMSQMPSGSFTMPDAQSYGNASELSPESTKNPGENAKTPVQETPQENNETEAPKANASQAADNSNQTGRSQMWQTQRNKGNDWTNGASFPGMSGANAGSQTSVSPATLLIASVIVLIISIAVALFIKH